jgi:hypothetical protein
MKMKSIVVIWEGNSFSFEVDEEMVKIEFGEYFAETGEYDKTWSVELSRDEWNDLGVKEGILSEDYESELEVQYDEEIKWETGSAIEEVAYVELKKRFIVAFKKDWENVISEMGGVELIFPEGEKEVITA